MPPSDTATKLPPSEKGRVEPHDRPTPHSNGSGAGEGDHGVKHGEMHNNMHPASVSEGEIPKDLPRPSHKLIVLVTIAIVVLFAVFLVLGWLPHHHEKTQTDADASMVASSLPIVSIQQPVQSKTDRDLFFPADVRPNQSTAIFTRATGYLKKWYVDIQDHVEAGQLLAEIDAPDIDAELQQAKANVLQDQANVVKAQADVTLAQSTLLRYRTAQKTSPGSVTEEQVDQEQDAYDDAVSALAQAKAAVAAGEANVQQFTVSVGFQKVVAPFSGVITARNYDNGAFLNPPTSANASREIFDIAQTDVLRVYISVPQPNATAVQVGKSAFLRVQNHPGKEFEGKVARTSQSLDETTKTLTVEVDFPNKDSQLLPGMYGQIRLPIVDAQPTLTIPTGALIFNADGLRIALVQDKKAHFIPVNVGRDFGATIEVTHGLATSDQVITNPSEKIAEGVEVQIQDGKPDSKPKS